MLHSTDQLPRFARKKQAPNIKIGISCWILRHGALIDLCVSKQKAATGGDLTKLVMIIECPDVITAKNIINTAR